MIYLRTLALQASFNPRLYHSDLVSTCVIADISPQIETRVGKEFCNIVSLAPFIQPSSAVAYTLFSYLHTRHLQSDLSPSLFRFRPRLRSSAAARLALKSISRAKWAAVPDTSWLRKSLSSSSLALSFDAVWFSGL